MLSYVGKHVSVVGDVARTRSNLAEFDCYTPNGGDDHTTINGNDYYLLSKKLKLQI